MAKLRTPIESRDHVLGTEQASVTLLEYGDYECPHCGRAHPAVQALISEYGDQLRYAYRHFPLVQIHPAAESAAETAEFAGALDRFWHMHNGLFENQDRLGIPLFVELADEIGLPSGNLVQALQSGQFAGKVREDFTGGVRSGVNGTPTFFINGERHEGAYEFEDLAAAIDKELVRKSVTQRRTG